MTTRPTPGWMIAALMALLPSFASVPGTTPGKPDGKVDPSLSAAAFERLKRLEGEWVGSSTKGWTEIKTFRTIAAGSVVFSTSFDAHPNETMLTAYHMDGTRLMLTHYCVARNQPRMVATEISDDGRVVVFSFLDGTGLASRDTGHMDSAVLTFIDEDHFKTRWSWYQNGEVRWMEEIHHQRSKEQSVR